MSSPGTVVLRRTPYELVFGPDRFETGIFPAIEAEAEARGTLAGGPESFVMLGTVGGLLRDLRPDDGAPDAAAGPPPEAIQQYGALTWHAWRFWRAGRPVYAVSPGLMDALLGDRHRIGTWRFQPPADAGYVQLPHNALWARVAEESAAEPIDGFHWTWLPADGTAGRALGQLDVLLALGLRPGRAGLSVTEIAATPAAADAGHWGDDVAREAGGDFENILPGGELQGWHGVECVAEVLKLVTRIFHWIERRPDTAVRGEPRATGDAGAATPVSRLPFQALLAAGDTR